MAAASGLAVSAACKEPTAPEPVGSLDVFLEDWNTYVELVDGWPTQVCAIRITLDAAGDEDVQVLYARFRFHLGEDREAAVDSTLFTAIQLSEFFGKVILEPGEQAQADLVASAPAPFEVSATFVYRQGGRQREHQSTHRTSCGATIPSGASPPTVQILEISASDPDPGAGDTIRVRYKVQSGAGLWASGLELAGPFEASRLNADAPHVSRERVEYFEVPPSVDFAVPVVVYAYAFDAALRYAEAESVSAIAIVDTMPPSVAATFPQPMYGTGDQVEFHITATDNFGLEWIHWQVGEPALLRDSVLVSGGARQAGHAVRFTVAPAWAGQAPAVTVWASDHEGRASAPVSYPPGTLRFYELTSATETPIESLGPPAGPMGQVNHVIYDPKRGRLYASHFDANIISVYDATTGSRTASVATPTFPAGLALSRTGDSLLVTTSFASALTIIGLDDLSPRDPVPVAAIDSIGPVDQLHPSGVAVTSAGLAVVQLNNTLQGSTRTVTVDLGAGTSRVRSEVPPLGWDQTSGRWRFLGTSPLGDRVLVAEPTCVRFYMSSTDAFTSCTDVSLGYLNQMAFSSDGSRIAVGNSLLDGDLATVRTFPSDHLVVTADGQTVLLMHFDSRLVRVRVADGAVLDARKLPFWPSTLILAEDLGVVFAVSTPSGQFVRLPIVPP